MSEGLKVIRAELPYFDEIEVFPIADLHLGDEFTDEKLIRSTVNYIMASPNRFVMLNGDLMNTALTTSVSDSYSEKYPPSKQIEITASILRPLADAGRILAMTSGNHEDRVYKATGIDMTAILAKELGILDRYSDNNYVLFVKFGRSIHADCKSSINKKNVYSFYCMHGAGGGRKSGGKLNRVMSMSESVDADIYVMSHVHDVMYKPAIICKTDIQNMTVSMMKREYLITNAWQSFGGYGMKFGFTPASNEIGYVILNGNGKKKTRYVCGI